MLNQVQHDKKKQRGVIAMTEDENGRRSTIGMI